MNAREVSLRRAALMLRAQKCKTAGFRWASSLRLIISLSAHFLSFCYLSLLRPQLGHHIHFCSNARTLISARFLSLYRLTRSAGRLPFGRRAFRRAARGFRWPSPPHNARHDVSRPTIPIANSPHCAGRGAKLPRRCADRTPRPTISL